MVAVAHGNRIRNSLNRLTARRRTRISPCRTESGSMSVGCLPALTRANPRKTTRSVATGWQRPTDGSRGRGSNVLAVVAPLFRPCHVLGMFSDVQEWGLAVLKQWVALSSGLASFLIGVWAHLKHQPDVDPWLFWVITALCLVAACFLAWRDERRAREILEQAMRPRLSLRFDPTRAPYVQEIPSGNTTLRYFRVGVQNDSHVDVSGIRIVLESCNFPTKPGINLEHRLAVMGAIPASDLATIAAGREALFDVAVESVHPPGSGIGPLALCYRAAVERQIDRSTTWRLVLRAEGAGLPVRGAFILREVTGSALPRVEMIETVL
jgi:hypothetical protein